MKKVGTVLMIWVLAAGLAGAGESPLTAEQSAVVAVVQDAYVDGIHNFRRVEAVRRGFHPGFEMLILQNDSLGKLPIYTWIENLERANRAKALPDDHAATTTARYLSVDVTGDAAVVKFELIRDEQVVFTDYLSLYRFSDGWKIVGKIFHRHS
jgi:hypothetical protein